MKKLVLCTMVIILAGCATAEVPPRVANTYEVTGKVYCDTPVFKNLETIIVGWLRATVAPTWEPVCGDREAEAEEAE